LVKETDQIFIYIIRFLKICVIEEDEDQLLTVQALKQQHFGYSAFFRLK